MKKRLLQYLLLPASLFALLQVPSAQADSPEDLFSKGKVFGQLRYRYENVDQAGLAHTTGVANTLRANLGFETGTYKDFKALVELQTVQRLGDDDYNDTVNGKTTYPTIADPENNEFNQAWIMWSGLPKTSLKLGRQNIILDNQRFVGNVGWRQNDQTYDAGTATFTPVEKLILSYSYVWNINRIFGEHNAIPDYTGANHLIHGEYTFADWLKIAAYDYLLDIHQKQTLSSQTYGAQATGKVPLVADLKLQYLAEYAHQADYKDSPINFHASYYHLSPSLLWKGVTLQAGMESLGGDGANAFQSPLATLHAFNGWADEFLTTPANGLEDRYGRVGYKLSGLNKWVDGTTFDAVYHDFNAENTSADYGTEWNFQVSKTFKTEDFNIKEWTVTAKYADYNADTLFTDTNKFWLMVDLKF
ncbi:MAG: hypothetical protein EPN97_10240 [Alphaproteobacteria bacterium]|nr:MAG: hypothetical protein EPN97_10240 [Alphaproteobacteria bacterium]